MKENAKLKYQCVRIERNLREYDCKGWGFREGWKCLRKIRKKGKMGKFKGESFTLLVEILA